MPYEPEKHIDDVHDSLHAINKRRSRQGIISQLVDIQESRVAQRKSLRFIENLECLFFVASRKRRRGQREADKSRLPTLHRHTINAFVTNNYVAVSYTWDPSSMESGHGTGAYQVQNRDQGLLEPSPVRNGVFERIGRFMDHHSVSHLWIDQHCIKQDDAKAKELGMQVMDRVYSLSKHPTALFARPITTEAELGLLTLILSRKLVRFSHGQYRLAPKIARDLARRAVELLRDMTSDVWFTRGWTFQENYRGGGQMILMVPHAPQLNSLKEPKLLGALDGELCLNSIRFHDEATKLCLAYQNGQPPQVDLCEPILACAGRYRTLLESRNADAQHRAPKSMSPTVIADINARKLTMGWDRLPITANCCQYSVRLDSTQLQAKGHSISLSMLALCLLNGEILFNCLETGLYAAAAQRLTVADFLKAQFFNGLHSPFAMSRNSCDREVEQVLERFINLTTSMKKERKEQSS